MADAKGLDARITKQADRFFELLPGTVVKIAGRKFERSGPRVEFLCEPGPEGTRLGVDCIDLAAWAIADRKLMGSAKMKQGTLLERLAMAAAELGAGDNALGDVLAWRVAAIGAKLAGGLE